MSQHTGCTQGAHHMHCCLSNTLVNLMEMSPPLQGISIFLSTTQAQVSAILWPAYHVQAKYFSTEDIYLRSALQSTCECLGTLGGVNGFLHRPLLCCWGDDVVFCLSSITEQELIVIDLRSRGNISEQFTLALVHHLASIYYSRLARDSWQQALARQQTGDGVAE